MLEKATKELPELRTSGEFHFTFFLFTWKNLFLLKTSLFWDLYALFSDLYAFFSDSYSLFSNLYSFFKKKFILISTNLKKAYESGQLLRRSPFYKTSLLLLKAALYGK